MPGAVVIVRFVSGGEQQTVTAGDGRFALPVAVPGDVTLIVRAPSFAEMRRTIPAGATAEVQVVLQPASLSETVTDASSPAACACGSRGGRGRECPPGSEDPGATGFDLL